MWAGGRAGGVPPLAACRTQPLKAPPHLMIPQMIDTGMGSRRVFGPSAAAARLEGSKSFMKDLCAKYGIPSGAHAAFTDADKAKSYIQAQVRPHALAYAISCRGRKRTITRFSGQRCIASGTVQGGTRRVAE